MVEETGGDGGGIERGRLGGARLIHGWRLEQETKASCRLGIDGKSLERRHLDGNLILRPTATVKGLPTVIVSGSQLELGASDSKAEAGDSFDDGGQDVRGDTEEAEAEDEGSARVQLPTGLATEGGSGLAVPGRSGEEGAVDGSTGGDVVKAWEGRREKKKGLGEGLAVGGAILFEEAK